MSLLRLLLVSLLFPLVLQGQTFSFQHFGIEDGLPSTEVHDVHQDYLGYIWLATDHGLCRFDGFEFKVFSTRDGLTDNTIFDIIEQPDSSLWLTTYSGGVCIFDGEKGRPHPYNDTILDFLGDFYIHHLEVKEDGSLRFRYMLSERRNQSTCHLDTLGNISIDSTLRSEQFLMPSIHPGQEADFFEALEKAIRQEELMAEPSCEYLFVPNGRKYWRTEEQLLVFDPATTSLDTLVYSFRHYATLEDQWGDAWFSSGQGGGLIRARYLHGSWQKEYFLPDMTVSDIAQDREGNIWISTVENGLFLLVNPGIQHFQAIQGAPGKILSLAVWQDRLWAGVHSGKSYSINAELEVETWDACEYTAGNFDMASTEDYLWSATKCLTTADGTDRYVLEKISPKAVAIGPGGNLYIGGILGIAHLQVSGRTLVKEQILSDSLTVYSLHLDAQNRLWVGALSGLWMVEDGELRDLRSLSPFFQTRITAIESFGKDTMLLATKGEGLLLYLPDTVIQINTPEGLNSQFIKSIYVEDKHTIWVGGNQGINQIHLDWDKMPPVDKVVSIQTVDGLPSNEVFDFIPYNGYLWMATSRGLCRMDLAYLNKPLVDPRLLITSVKVNGEELNGAGTLQLDARENNLRFEYIGLFFRNPENVRYQYQLVGYDDSWQETRLRELSYTNLPAGEYQFKLRAGSSSENWNVVPVEMRFTIQKPYYQRWWFVGLSILGGILLISGIFLEIIRRQQVQAAIERRVIQSEQKALRAQINPHFVFNAMNSIQYFITENDRHNAGIYLSRFSKLMRRILDNSKKNWIMLEEELSGMRHYLELEQMRFSERFDYRITLDPEIDPYETEIPSMILQPFLENALWHGLMKKTTKGLLTIDFKIAKGVLRCVIEDDGIGRAEAAKHRRKRHTSTGLQNVQERIQLINAQDRTRMQLKIEDLVDGEGIGCGTRVIIDFPWKG
jgi:ligand-binding sensor domain-containing protein